ncbi:hypothetical protein [Thermoactinomyces sp. DSM 45892]|uniref:hypothetical protein n=1 Tax=Thermoactinomyces sp. DSM 45892 TaxID=1882753 RepID=UPI00089C944B|nr:hypothetical protein [Thermoactinomyces sp. DSM 45892]SDY87748.1 hypothetical protein SAMN05444416_109144 [Thermoactinomyces sp. DSM 45892]
MSLIHKIYFSLLVLIGTLYFVDLVSPSFNQLFHSIIHPYTGIETSLKLAIPFLLTMGCMGWVASVICTALKEVGFRLLYFTSIAKYMLRLTGLANRITTHGFTGGILLIMASKVLGFEEIATEGFYTIFPNANHLSFWEGFVKVMLFTFPVALIFYLVPFAAMMSRDDSEDYLLQKAET